MGCIQNGNMHELQPSINVPVSQMIPRSHTRME